MDHSPHAPGAFDRWLRDHTPDATKLPTCPWFLAICVGCALAIASGLLSQTIVGYVVGVAAALLVGREIGQRETGHEAHRSCAT